MKDLKADGRRSVVVAAIWAPVALLLIVAVMTWRAERRQAAVDRQVVHDYAAIAAWQLARRVNMALHDETMHAVSGVVAGHMRSASTPPLVDSGVLLHRGDDARAFTQNALFALRYEPGTGVVHTAGAMDSVTRAALTARLHALASTSRREDEPHRMIFERAGDRITAVALLIVGPMDGAVTRIYGVGAPASALDSAFRHAVQHGDLLPGIAAQQVARNGLAVSLERRQGGIVFRTSTPLGETAATDSTGLRLSELRAVVDVPPGLARALVGGERGGSLLLPFMLMIVVAVALALMALAQMRRSRELDELRARFVANVSHELRTPLTQISMFAETLRLGRERSSDERIQFASIIHAEARRLTHMVESILRFARGGPGVPRRVEPRRVDVEVEQAVEAFEPIAAAARVELRVETEPVELSVDPDGLRQVILNLLDNAVKHGGSGGVVQVRLALHDGETRLTVDDAGPGVPRDWRDRVFEPFARAERSAVSGAGIGLSVVRDIVASHAGRVWIESSPLGGARVVVAIRGGVALDTPSPDVSTSHLSA